MQLTHVCIWDPQIGYRRITIQEACRIYPHKVSAKSGHFVCELCAQNVLLTESGINARHFRHDPASPNKECEERQAYFDPNYGRSLRSLNGYTIPLRIRVIEKNFLFQLGFFSPPNTRAHCDKIKVTDDGGRTYEYSFERIEKIGTTYLNVGAIPSSDYKIEYINANMELMRFWSQKISGIKESGTFFDYQTGKILQSGGKAYSDDSYYLLQKHPLYSNIDVEITEITRMRTTVYTTWYLYKIRIKRFSIHSAQFFLKYSIFLTEKPTKFYPIWPTYIKDPYFLYHNSNEFYLYLSGDDAELQSYPTAASIVNVENGRLYKLYTREREQLVSLGRSGALGFSYLIKQPLNKKVSLPSITIVDDAGNELNDQVYKILPKKKFISISSQYDGKVELKKNGKIAHTYMIWSNKNLVIEGLSYGVAIYLYQGKDCVRTISFEREKSMYDVSLEDENMVRLLQSCSDIMIPTSHTMGTLSNKYISYPKTRKWIYGVLRKGEISRKALQLLKNYIPKSSKEDSQ